MVFVIEKGILAVIASYQIDKMDHMGWFKELDFFYIKIILLNKYKLPVM